MAITVESMQKQVRSELSTGSRLGHTAVGVAGVGMAALALSLLATEPALPARTQAAFVVIALGGLAWASFATWVLTRRRVLMARHHVAAAALATTLSAIFLAGAVVLLREQARLLAVAVNAAMLAFAVLWLMRARRRVAELQARYAALDPAR
ncbi:MAG: transmembrane transport protein [Vicinamibacterales bacterium]